MPAPGDWRLIPGSFWAAVAVGGGVLWGTGGEGHPLEGK